MINSNEIWMRRQWIALLRGELMSWQEEKLKKNLHIKKKFVEWTSLMIKESGSIEKAQFCILTANDEALKELATLLP